MHDDTHWMDQYIAPGLRLWMLIGLVGSVLLSMTIIVCCFMRIRIPRTKRQIELMSAKRAQRKQRREGGRLSGQNGVEPGYDRGQTIVMNSLATRPPGRGDRSREPLNSHSANV
ncbi:unnamed protein product [Bursaphelenchus okinawaensis]|uniref:Uncharacterized protein n=1 Tax=Bursaphelenchus okinawaensis TaxID=465554 RepID=A0A811KS83_9BILA|nr:unnamed protein product [Bursaphelenchus okinawaensis]CAG9112284.1 unnamed protein product [Bursaphelenchus okinawaensis]